MSNPINDRLNWSIEKQSQWVARYKETVIVARTKTELMSKINEAINNS